jgi:P-type Na+/K+ transporter
MGKAEETAAAQQQHVSGQSNKPLSRPAHALSHEDVVSELETDALDGLAPAEAARRLEAMGKNQLGEAEGAQPLKIIVAQIANAMTLVRFSASSECPVPDVSIAHLSRIDRS